MGEPLDRNAPGYRGTAIEDATEDAYSARRRAALGERIERRLRTPSRRAPAASGRRKSRASPFYDIAQSFPVRIWLCRFIMFLRAQVVEIVFATKARPWHSAEGVRGSSCARRQRSRPETAGVHACAIKQ